MQSTNVIAEENEEKQDTSETLRFENTVNEESDDCENADHTKEKEHAKCKVCTRKSKCVPCSMHNIK